MLVRFSSSSSCCNILPLDSLFVDSLLEVKLQALLRESVVLLLVELPQELSVICSERSKASSVVKKTFSLVLMLGGQYFLPIPDGTSY